MSIRKYLPFTVLSGCILFLTPLHSAGAAALLAQQDDGSASAGMRTSCDNRCTDITAGTQTFMAAATGVVGTIRIFTTNFGTSSRYPDTNSCYLTVRDDADGTLLGRSDNSFSGYGCAGDLMFTFKDSHPFLTEGTRYRWDYVFGGQNFSSISFLGSTTGETGETFSLPPLAEARFMIYAEIPPPSPAGQFQGMDPGSSDGGSLVPPSGTSPVSTIAFTARVGTPLPDDLGLQVEVEPSFVGFSGAANAVSLMNRVETTSIMRVFARELPNGGYHWQARTVDGLGNTSPWVAPEGDPIGPAIFIEDGVRGDAVLEDRSTIYRKNTQPDPCFGDGSPRACALIPSSTPYAVPGPFTMTKITFDWMNLGSNNCDGYGRYGAVIAPIEMPEAIIATSTNDVYLGCGRGEQGTGELDFGNKIVPARFLLTFGAFDGVLQGGADVRVANVTVHGIFASDPPASASPSSTPSGETAPSEDASGSGASARRRPIVIVPGMLGSRIARESDGRELWPAADMLIASSSDAYLEDLALGPDGREISGKEADATDIIRTVTTSIPFVSMDFYRPLLDSLAAMGYREGTDLFVAPYDWRLSVEEGAKAITPVMERAAGLSLDGTIDIIAHSMGSLLAEEFLAHEENASSVNKAILVAPPNLGTPKMFKMLQYGDDLGFRIGPLPLLDPSKTKSIAQNMPAAYQLIPSERYTDAVGGYLIDNRNGGHRTLGFGEMRNFMTTGSGTKGGRNAFLLDAAETFHAARDAATPAKGATTIKIIGCGDPATIGGFVLREDGGMSLMRGNGDGTVPAISAMGSRGADETYFSLYSENGADHLGLIKDANPLTFIDALLNDTAGALALDAFGMSTSTEDCMNGRRNTARRETTIEVAVRGSVLLEADAYDGARTDEGKNGIPGSSMERIGDSTSLLLPASGTYRMILRATASGSAIAVIRAYDDAARLQGAASYIGIPFETASDTAEISISSENMADPRAPSPSLSLVHADGSAGTPIPPTAILSANEAADTEPPRIEFSEGTHVLQKSGVLASLFTVRDPGSGIGIISVSVDGIPMARSTDGGSLTEGGHRLTVDAIDGAGNERTAMLSFEVAKDTITPTVVQVPAGNPPPRRCKPRPTSTVP